MLVNYNNLDVNVSHNLVPYMQAMAEMEQRHEDVLSETKPELIWFLQHEHTYTAGISAQHSELLNANNVPVFYVKRGGKFTYHGPGQVVCYLVCNLKQYSNNKLPDVRCFVACLEDVIIKTLQQFGIAGQKRNGRIGVWVETDRGDEKIAAIGVKFSKCVTMHGFAINVDPDLSKFKGIVPCGISDFGICSFASLGVVASISDVIDECKRNILNAQKNGFFQSGICAV